MTADRLARTERALERAALEAGSVVELCRGVQRVLDPIVPSDRWCSFAVDPSTLLATNGYHDEGVDAHLLPRLLELEVAAADYNQLPALARTPSGVGTLSAATRGDPATSARWRDVLVPSGLSHELRAVFRLKTQVWGALVLFRGSDVGDFDAADEAFLERVGPVIARGFRSALVRQHLEFGADAREAGVLVVGGDPPTTRSLTPAARHWLDLLDDRAVRDLLPTAVQNAVLAARRHPAVPSIMRARTRSGRWLTITAEPTLDAGDPPDVGVVIQPSRPAEIAQIVTAAHGLTAREAEVVVLVASGRTNDEIARSLSVSAHTVADHLKRVFAKLDVSTRTELTAKLFFGEYVPRVIGGLDAGVDGWFLPG